MSHPFYEDLRDETDVFDGVFGRAPTTVNLALENTTEPVSAEMVSGFAGLAVLLAVVGVYGVMSFVVSHRTREIGIRMALGASRGAAVRLILSDAGLMLAVGVAIALPAVWALGRLIESQLFGVGAMDWPTVLIAGVLVACAALAASALPVRRATAISPIQALRHE